MPFENILQNDKDTGIYWFGDTPTIVDICLIPNVVNNAPFEVDMTSYPKINSVYKACLNNTAFYDALPKNQPDAES
jgi:maleylpyruvate isomerase